MHTTGLYEFLLAAEHLQGSAHLARRGFAPSYLLDLISSAAAPGRPLGLSLICMAAKHRTQRKSIIGPELWRVSAHLGPRA